MHFSYKSNWISEIIRIFVVGKRWIAKGTHQDNYRMGVNKVKMEKNNAPRSVQKGEVKRIKV